MKAFPNDLQKKMIALLRKNARMSLVVMSNQLGIPKTTLYDNLHIIEQHYLFTVKKK